jgi:hypothetical protein
MVWDSSPSGGKRFPSPKTQSDLGAHPPTYSTGTGLISGSAGTKLPGNDV